LYKFLEGACQFPAAGNGITGTKVAKIDEKHTMIDEFQVDLNFYCISDG